MENTAPPLQQRQFWMSVLSRASVKILEQHWEQIENKPGYEFIRPPEVGLVMVRGRAGGTGEAFNMGETTVSRCTLRLSSGQTGSGYVRTRSKRHAELCAVFDALLQTPEKQQALMETVILPLHGKWIADRNSKRESVEKTKVEFFTMVRGE